MKLLQFLVLYEHGSPSCSGFRLYGTPLAPVGHALVGWLVGIDGVPRLARNARVDCFGVCERVTTVDSWRASESLACGKEAALGVFFVAVSLA